jgi:DNA-binding NarL/FixJ family response regulator
MSPNAAVTCVIVDDHPAILSTLRDELTERGITVVATARTKALGLEAIAARSPAVAVIDVNLGKDSGLDLAREAIAASVAVVLFTGEDAGSLLDEAMRIGVAGIVRKDAPLADISRAVRSVAAGEPFIDPRLIGPLVQVADATLSDRERSVLSALADGQQYQEIGDRLGIGVDTVRSHVQKAIRKLGSGSRTGAVATALRLKLID